MNFESSSSQNIAAIFTIFEFLDNCPQANVDDLINWYFSTYLSTRLVELDHL